MRVKLDENLGLAPKALLLELGHDAQRVTDEGLSGAADEVVWEHVCEEGRLLITLDLRFSDRRKYPPGTHPGIILLRLHSRSRPAVMTALRRLLEEQPLENLAHCLAVVEEQRTRIARPIR